jgi:hypothetical protein
MIYIFHGSDSFSRWEAVEALKRSLIQTARSPRTRLCSML